MVDGSSIRFVVPTTISPRYNPSLGGLQQPDQTPTKFTQKTPYSLWFQAHVARGDQRKTARKWWSKRPTHPFDVADQISQVANLSHAVNAIVNGESIDISMSSIALDRDIILDIDLPDNRPTTLVSVEKDPTTETHGVLLSFTPHLADFAKVTDGSNETNTEFIFIGTPAHILGEGALKLSSLAL